MWRGFLLGAAVGLAIGWLVFRRGEDSTGSERAVPTSDVEAAGPTLSSASSESPLSVTEAGADAPPPAAETLRTASADDLQRRWNASGNETVGPTRRDVQERLTAEEARILLDRAKEALRARDSALFMATVRGLARADGDEADAFLLEVMGDTSLPMPGPLGKYFLEALEESRLPGIAQAARARFEAEIAAGRDHWWGADGWLHLVAVHGGPDDVEWVRELARAKDRSPQVRRKAAEALSRSSNPAAVAAFEAGVDGLLRAEDLEPFVSANPERGVALLERLLSEGSPRFETRALWVAYARSAPLDRLADLERRLLEATGVGEKADAVYAVEALSRRGRDVSRVTPIVSHLLDWLVANVDRTDVKTQGDRDRVLHALEHNRIAWTRETLDVLERVAPEADATKEIRTHLASPWR